MKFERFTDRARRVVVLAMGFAGPEEPVGPKHIFRGLVAEREGLAALALASVGINHGRVWLGDTTTGTLGSNAPNFTDGAKKIMELSLRESLEAEDGFIGTEHLLAAWIRYAVHETKGQ